MTNFFFFGSLRDGYWNNKRCISKTAIKVGEAVTVAPYKLYVGQVSHVPTICPDPKGGPVHGELWQLNDTDAKVVDRLEAGYESGEIEVKLPDGTIHKAIGYYHEQPEHCPYLRGGYWVVSSGDYTTIINKDATLVRSSDKPKA